MQSKENFSSLQKSNIVNGILKDNKTQPAKKLIFKSLQI